MGRRLGYYSRQPISYTKIQSLKNQRHMQLLLIKINVCIFPNAIARTRRRFL